MMKDSITVKWLPQPEDHNYPAALSYLNLMYDNDTSTKLVKQLKNAGMISFKAKDIFRASGLSLLGVSNVHIEKNTKKITKGTGISPLLLVRDSDNRKVIIADGYHRLCAVYMFNEDEVIPCKIV